MDAAKLAQRFNDGYTRFRASYGSLLLLVSLVGTAVTAHFYFGWDADWGATNLILSIMAEVSCVMMIIHQARAEKYQRHLLEAMHAILQREEEPSE